MKAHEDITAHSHPFEVGDLSNNQFLFLWALYRLEKSGGIINEKSISVEMENMVGGERTFGGGAIRQLYDEMREKGLIEEKKTAAGINPETVTRLSAAGVKKLKEIYQANKAKGLEPYKGLSVQAPGRV